MTPEGWTVYRLADLAQNVTAKSQPNSGDTRRYIALEHLAQGSPVLLGWSAADTATSTKTEFQVGDILFGKLRPNLRKAVIAPFDGVCSTDILALRVLDPPMHKAYLLHLAHWPPLQEHAVSTATGTKMPRTSWNLLGKFLVPLPPLPEQRKIAAILSSVDEAIEKTQAVIDQLKVVKKAMMQELLTRGLPGRHTRFKMTEIGEVPEEWEVIDLSALGEDPGATLRTGPFGSSLKTEHFRGSGVPVLTIQSLGSGSVVDDGLFFVDEAKAKELYAYRVEPGDLVFSRVADVGRSIVVPERGAGWIISSNLMRIRIDKKRFDSDFLMYSIVGSPFVLSQLENLVADAGRQVVSSPVLKKLRFAVPRLPEQVTISQSIRAVEARVAGENSVKDGFMKAKSALMSVLLTGEVRVKAEPDNRSQESI